MRRMKTLPPKAGSISLTVPHTLSPSPLCAKKGYRSENRFTVFQALTHTVDSLDPVAVRIFAKSHNERNLAEYQGRTEVDERLLGELIRCTIDLQKAVLALEPPAK